VVSKRVANAKSERFYRAGLGKKKEPGFWQVGFNPPPLPPAAIVHCLFYQGLSCLAVAMLPSPPMLTLPLLQGIRKSLAAHPLIVAFIFFITVFSGHTRLRLWLTVMALAASFVWFALLPGMSILAQHVTLHWLVVCRHRLILHVPAL
jgi:hypothetical protein